MNKRLLFGLGIVLVVALGGVAVWWLGAWPGQQAGTSVPVELRGAKNLGSLQLELAYDPAVLEATDVKAGDLAKNGMVEYNLTAAGRLAVGVIHASGMNGDGPVVSVSFKVLKEGETSPLTLNSVQAHDANTLLDIPLRASAGGFSRDGLFTGPVISLTP